MFRGLILSASLLFSSAAYSFDIISEVVSTDTLARIAKIAVANDGEDVKPNLALGESANYSLVAGSFIRGTMIASVAEETDKGFWVHQDIDILGNKQNIKMHVTAQGAILEIIVNGEPQDLPDTSNPPEVIETAETEIKVPAGTFKALYVKTKDEKGAIAEAWVNPRDIPVFGLIKLIQPSQIGKTVIELTSFARGNLF